MLPQRWTSFKAASDHLLIPNLPAGWTDIRLGEDANPEIFVILLVGAITLFARGDCDKVRKKRRGT
jgi:hypothetical protein